MQQTGNHRTIRQRYVIISCLHTLIVILATAFMITGFSNVGAKGVYRSIKQMSVNPNYADGTSVNEDKPVDCQNIVVNTRTGRTDDHLQKQTLSDRSPLIGWLLLVLIIVVCMNGGKLGIGKANEIMIVETKGLFEQVRRFLITYDNRKIKKQVLKNLGKMRPEEVEKLVKLDLLR